MHVHLRSTKDKTYDKGTEKEDSRYMKLSYLTASLSQAGISHFYKR
jgi:hypothetical protein